MVERWMSSYVSGESEVELKCFSMVEKRIPLMGRPTFPFIGQGKDLGYTREREKEEKRKRKTEEETAPGTRPPPVGVPCWSCR
jgi:hypothetical protein